LRSYDERLRGAGIDEVRVVMHVTAMIDRLRRRKVKRRIVNRGMGRPKRVCCLGILSPWRRKTRDVSDYVLWNAGDWRLLHWTDVGVERGVCLESLAV
jgi:hypothetical protein